MSLMYYFFGDTVYITSSHAARTARCIVSYYLNYYYISANINVIAIFLLRSY